MKKNGLETTITTLIGEGAELTGNFSAKGSVRIDGKIEGDVNISGKLILGAAGWIDGDVSADSVMIGGQVFGDINATSKAELASTARVIGDITTETIVIDEHAIFQGGCNMNQEVPEKKGKVRSAKAVKEGRKTAKIAIEEALKEVQEGEGKEASDTEFMGGMPGNFV